MKRTRLLAAELIRHDEQSTAARVRLHRHICHTRDLILLRPASSCNVCAYAAIKTHKDKLTQDHKGMTEGRCEADLRPADFGAACEAALGGDAHPSLC